jgi:hypothetical protein
MIPYRITQIVVRIVVRIIVKNLPVERAGNTSEHLYDCQLKKQDSCLTRSRTPPAIAGVGTFVHLRGPRQGCEVPRDSQSPQRAVLIKLEGTRQLSGLTERDHRGSCLAVNGKIDW